ncbi:hypothetical protein ACIBHX_29900 [Nonomuraea sp. NPDC050536]|uniref:hypothetical protein n=1 Tax=Nonomuraea sp. NPDC050536 TaxID=3364366 RepID=UPI0037C5C6E5
MSEFAAELRVRIDEVEADLTRAHGALDDHAVQVLTGRLDNLLRIAREHGIDVRLPAVWSE